MVVHCVFFWLKTGLSEAEQADFWRGLRTLANIATVENFHAGKPAATTKRPVIDDSFSASLVLRFRDVAAHEAYQGDPIHLKFVADCQRYWTRVQVYDSN